MRVLLVLVLAALAGLAGCGGGDDAGAGASVGTEETAALAPARRASLRDGETFHPDDLLDCLLDAGVRATLSLDGPAIDRHEARARVMVERGGGELMVYGSLDRAAAREDAYRASFGRLSEVRRVRNVLLQADPDLASQARAAVMGCLGLGA